MSLVRRGYAFNSSVSISLTCLSRSNAVETMQRACQFFNVSSAARHNYNRGMQLKKIISFSDESRLATRPRQSEISV